MLSMPVALALPHFDTVPHPRPGFACRCTCAAHCRDISLRHFTMLPHSCVSASSMHAARPLHALVLRSGHVRTASVPLRTAMLCSVQQQQHAPPPPPPPPKARSLFGSVHIAGDVHLHIYLAGAPAAAAAANAAQPASETTAAPSSPSQVRGRDVMQVSSHAPCSHPSPLADMSLVAAQT